MKERKKAPAMKKQKNEKSKPGFAEKPKSSRERTKK